MRTFILTIAAIACFSGIASAQSSQSSSSNKPPQEPTVDSRNAIIDPILTSEQINKLPIRKFIRRPQITLQRALKIAETYVRKGKINLSKYFLLEARLIPYGSGNNDKDFRWFFQWVSDNGTIIHRLEILVSMDGKVSRLPVM